MSSSRTLSRKLRTSLSCMNSRFNPSIILLYRAASVEQYCDIMQANALPENDGILELLNSFIQIVDAEMDRHDCSFVRESLTEMLENLRIERQNYALVSGI